MSAVHPARRASLLPFGHPHFLWFLFPQSARSFTRLDAVVVNWTISQAWPHCSVIAQRVHGSFTTVPGFFTPLSVAFPLPLPFRQVRERNLAFSGTPCSSLLCVP